MDWENIRFKIDTEFHLLRHFRVVNPELAQKLMVSDYTQEQIDEVLSLPGSRFNKDFATSIDDLIEHLKNAVVKEHVGLNGNRIITADFPRDIYKEGVGTIAILPFSELDAFQQSKVYQAENRGYQLKHLEVSNLPYSWQFTIILSEKEDVIQLITAFPGVPGLPLPDERMAKELFEQSVAYWEDQVFLVEGVSSVYEAAVEKK